MWHFYKTYDQFFLFFINEIFIINNRMLTFIDCKLRILKQVHNEFMGSLDVIMIGEFYQTPSVWDSWIFKQINNIFNTIA
jgi:hypothetical protein